MKKSITIVEFEKVCDLLLGRVDYFFRCRRYDFKNNIQFRPLGRKTEITIFQPFLTIQQFYSTGESLHKVIHTLPAFTCAKYKPQGRIERQFKIMAGPDESSVILLEPVRYTDKIYLVPVELIENLHWNYILHIEDWF